MTSARRINPTQVLKWTVYSLLLINLVYYAVQEAGWAVHTLRQGGSFLDWTEAFETTIDEIAWFGLLFMFELETYLLDDDAFERRPWLGWSIHGARLVCYLFLAHTVLARVSALDTAWTAPHRADITSPCALADGEHSWGANYHYTALTPDNCDGFTQDERLYMLEPTVVTDSAGWLREKQHTVIDLVDAITWLLVIWAIELAIWLQNRNITGGPLMVASHAAKFFYFILFMDAAWWVYTGHWVWAWDQFLWICGFWAIESNLSEWRDWIRWDKARALVTPG